MTAPVLFQWTEIARLKRSRIGRDGRTRTEQCVRARCSCGTERVMTLSHFEQRRSHSCKRCSLARAYAHGWASPRLVQGRKP